MSQILLWASIAVGVLLMGHLWFAQSFSSSISGDVSLLETLGEKAVRPREDLPPAIEAFARRGLGGVPRGVVRLRQQGTMRLESDAAWSPMTAAHVASSHESSFVWRAEVQMMPLVKAVVVDSYVAGTGRLEARLLGSIRVAVASGDEVDRAELMRYLAELPWTPEAILYNRSIRWSQLSDRQYEAAADSKGGEARVRISVDEAGDITQVVATDRPRTVPGGMELNEWRGVFSEYGVVDGYRVPREGKVSWVLPEGEFVYWRGVIVGVGGR